MNVEEFITAVKEGKTVRDSYHNTLIYSTYGKDSKYPSWMLDGPILISFNEMEASKETVGIFIMYDNRYKGLVKPENFEVTE